MRVPFSVTRTTTWEGQRRIYVRLGYLWNVRATIEILIGKRRR